MNATDGLARTILLCRDYVSPGLRDADICAALQSCTVLIRSDAVNISSHSGQTAAVTLALLLSRMGMQVLLDFPETRLASIQPPVRGHFLREGLTDLSQVLIPGAAIRIVESHDEPTLSFYLGDTVAVNEKSTLHWVLTGHDTLGALNQLGVGESSRWISAQPLGAMVAAALAAGEAFKAAIRVLPFRLAQDREFFEKGDQCSWDFGPVNFANLPSDLGTLDVISAGAISQAALYSLLRIPNLQFQGRIFDDDVTGPSNLNRNMLSLREDVGKLKVDIVTRRCGPLIQLSPRPLRYGSSGEIAELARQLVVGVDNIPNRWEIQRAAPGWVAVSGTTHFSVSSSLHRPGEPCAGCLHPVDDPDARDIPTVSFVSFWAGLSLAVRVLKEAAGCGYPPNKQHLWITPLRTDLRRAAVWTPVPPIPSCPVGCTASKKLMHAT
jgi:hypothetical protein